MTKRKLDQTHESFIERLKNIFSHLNNLATFMYFKKVSLSIESFTKASHCTEEEIQYLALIAPDMIKLENGLIMMKIKDRKKNVSASMKARLDAFNAQLLLISPDGLKEILDDQSSKDLLSLGMDQFPFRDQRIEMDPPRCLLKCLMNINNASFYKGQMSDVVVEDSLDSIYGILTESNSLGELDSSWPVSILPSFKLYSHQVYGLGHVQNGDHVMVSSKTSSGKSLIYQLPILKGLYESNNFRALLIFPTKVTIGSSKI